jgi:hypothetical protein
MLLRASAFVWVVLLVLAVACGGTGKGAKLAPGEPRNAKEKQLQEAKKSGELDDANPTKFRKWRYEGERKDCRFVLGKKCFKTENAACQAARCKLPQRCKSIGGGPATMTCQ